MSEDPQSPAKVNNDSQTSQQSQAEEPPKQTSWLALLTAHAIIQIGRILQLSFLALPYDNIVGPLGSTACGLLMVFGFRAQYFALSQNAGYVAGVGAFIFPAVALLWRELFGGGLSGYPDDVDLAIRMGYVGMCVGAVGGGVIEG